MAEIVLYSNGCPKCRVLEAKLSAKSIEFKKSENFDKLMELGKQSLPVLEVSGTLLDFPEANDWVNKYSKDIKKENLSGEVKFEETSATLGECVVCQC